MIFSLKKITHFLSKPRIFIPVLIILLLLSLIPAKAVYDKLREPNFYQPREEVKLTFPIGNPQQNQTVQIKEPGRKALLPGTKWVPQTFNNCVPATTSMILQYFGFEVSQAETKAALRTNPDDKNVFTYEMAEYIKTKYNIDSKLLYGGNIHLLKRLVANGFYVVVEDWLHPNEDIGHVTIIRGFDDEEGVFIADDSFIGINITYPYEQFDQTQWKAFNREYLPLFKPGNEKLLKAIIGESWDEEHMYEKAAKTAREEIAKNEQDMYAWFNLGTSLYALKNYQEAKLAFEKSRSLGWPKRMLWYQIQPVQTYNKLLEYEKALVYADIGLWSNDSFAELHLEKAISYKGLGNSEKAKEEVEKALFYAPNFKQAQEFLASFDLTSAGVGPFASIDDSVLGVTDFGPVSGTPIIPPSYLTLYFVVYLALLFALYIHFYRKKRLLLLWHKLRLFVVLAIILKASIAIGGSLLALYWLLPAPQIRRTIPASKSTSFSPMKRIEIVFDRPVDRNILVKSISPEMPGRFVFEDSIYTTHLYRRLVFYPTYSFRPNTTYTVTLSGIQNLISISKPYEYQFTFTTIPSPNISAVLPLSGKNDVDIHADITIKLDNPNENLSEFTFQSIPQFSYDLTLDPAKKTYTLNPKTPLRQGTTYVFKIQKSDIRRNLEDGTIAERGIATTEYEGTITTKEAPGILFFTPSGTGKSITSDINISFSQKMNKASVQKNFTIEPKIAGRFVWSNDTRVTFVPNKLSFETKYKITVAKGATALDGGFLEEDAVKTFTTFGKVKVSQFTPSKDLSAINIHSPIEVTFDQEVDQESAQQKFSLSKSAKGSFSWKVNTMIFTPEKPLEFNTVYTVVISKGVKSIEGEDSQVEFKNTFTTQLATTKLSVPAYLQKYSLSCELASLRMALNFRGLTLSEDDLIPLVGLDKTPHNGNVWGNPYNAFVGNIKGRQMADGYGVYWGPIAKAARNFRNAQEFQGFSIEQLTKELANNNPVIIWVYSHAGIKTSWNTPEGTNIYAVRDEHAVVAVGFVGPQSNPTQLIINDPLIGQVYWPRANFDRKWDIFGRSGVVVY